MNLKYTEEVFCKACGKSLGTNWKAHRRTYCSRKCSLTATRPYWGENTGPSGPFQKSRDWQDKILLEGAPYSEVKTRWTSLRRRLIDEVGHCEVCGQPPVWNGKPLSLQVDHIDGDLDNNKRKNLRVICIHCHSQTPHYGSKNKGRGRRLRSLSNKTA